MKSVIVFVVRAACPLVETFQSCTLSKGDQAICFDKNHLLTKRLQALKLHKVKFHVGLSVRQRDFVVRKQRLHDL